MLVLLLLAAASPVLDTARSPHARLRPVPVSAVQLQEGFWTPRRAVNLRASLPSLLELFEQNGILDNFRRLSARKQTPRRGPLYTDSDVYKWLEAVAWSLASSDEPRLRAAAQSVINDIIAAQEPSGYLNTYYSAERRAERHTNMRHGHEYYCLGHLIQAAIAWQRATGERRLLDAALRMVEYSLREFGPGKKPLMEGHPEIELALIELYRSTSDRRLLDFARYFLLADSRIELSPRDLTYLFTGKPFTARTHLEGHAVRAMYACAGATDYYLETGDPAFRSTLDRLWLDMANHKLYLTGGVGSRASGEAFGEPYELPNQQAYTESCAAIGVLFWNWRMLAVTADSRYADLLERALYNGVNSGLSLDGRLYCYRNPLELVGNPADRIRNPWYDTTCCPPNLQRVLASLPGYFYSTSQEGLWVHLYHSSTLDWRLDDSTPVRLTQSTRYPWDGRIEFTVHPARPAEFTLFLRVPAWAGGPRLLLPSGTPLPRRNGYLPVRRRWQPGERVVLTLDVAPRVTKANSYLRENVGRVAVERGPLVYCMEGLDQPQGSALFDWWLNIGAGRPVVRERWRPDLLGGVLALQMPAHRRPGGPSQPLYQRYTSPPLARTALVTLIPYYSFANRQPTPMQVWIPYR